jgi:hypothetical protein
MPVSTQEPNSLVASFSDIEGWISEVQLLQDRALNIVVVAESRKFCET